MRRARLLRCSRRALSVGVKVWLGRTVASRVKRTSCGIARREFVKMKMLALSSEKVEKEANRKSVIAKKRRLREMATLLGSGRGDGRVL